MTNFSDNSKAASNYFYWRFWELQPTSKVFVLSVAIVVLACRLS